MSEQNQNEKQPLIRLVNRRQMSWRAVDVEQLIGEDHPARAIWKLVGRLDLRPFYHAIESNVEQGGRPAIDPQLLLSLWIYAYSLGIGSAREVARRCEYDPAFQWLTGLEEVNYHTLADFRVERPEELDELFTQVLGVLSAEGLITLEQVMQDGTKIRALASPRSFRDEATIREHLEQARRRVAEMGDPREEAGSAKARQARVRARRDQQKRLQNAIEELEKLRKSKSSKARNQKRISISEPEARVMRHADGGRTLSYNAQVSADAAHGFIVGAAVTQAANDWDQLIPAVQRIEERLQRKPRQMIADAGYTTRATIEAMAERKLDFLGSMPREDISTGRTTPGRLPPNAFVYQPEKNRFLCPEGKQLYSQGRRRKGPGMMYYHYEAKVEDCLHCARKPECCPENRRRGRSVMRMVESATVSAFRQKMETQEARASYRRRARVVEFCHAWIKDKLGLRQFHVRGLVKVQAELLWACLTYNLQLWSRLQKLRIGPATG
jgi:transposase